MLTIFNRKELLISFDMKRVADVREILAADGIDYYVKVDSRQGGLSRGRTGTLGQDPKYMYEYVIYVRKENWERAKYLIGR